MWTFEHFLNIMRMRFLTNQNAADVKLIKS